MTIRHRPFRRYKFPVTDEGSARRDALAAEIRARDKDREIEKYEMEECVDEIWVPMLYLTMFGLPSEPYNEPYNNPIAGYEEDEDINDKPSKPLSEKQIQETREAIFKAYDIKPLSKREEKQAARIAELSVEEQRQQAHMAAIVYKVVIGIIIFAIVLYAISRGGPGMGPVEYP
jgi:hypothetical protein